MRLDLYLSENKLSDSRNKAAALIRDGMVYVNGAVVTKPSFDVTVNDKIVVSADCYQYVARSAHKLITAKSRFNLMFKDKVAVDLGSSTGGFCEVMLQNEIEHVYAVDIGTNQLHNRIKSSDKITSLENTNARFLTSDMFERQIDIVTCDLSFISLKLVLQSVYNVLKDDGEFVCLVKPQFEVGPAFVSKNGVVKNKKAIINAINDVIDNALIYGFSVYDISFSGLEGESGNKEYLLYIIKDNKKAKIDSNKINSVVLGD